MTDNHPYVIAGCQHAGSRGSQRARKHFSLHDENHFLHVSLFEYFILQQC